MSDELNEFTFDGSRVTGPHPVPAELRSTEPRPGKYLRFTAEAEFEVSGYTAAEAEELLRVYRDHLAAMRQLMQDDTAHWRPGDRQHNTWGGA